MSWLCRSAARTVPPSAAPGMLPPEAPDRSTAQSAAILALSHAMELLLAELRNGATGNYDGAAEALRRAQAALATTLGQAALGAEALAAQTAQRADPVHSPHFGG